ncbi:MAG: hypothetical protein ACFE0Q_21380 [Anaerolineae bacterium]
MSMSIEHLQDENIIVVTYGGEVDLSQAIADAQAQIADILDAHEGIFYRIDDLSQVEMDWNALVIGLAEATRPIPGSMTDPRIRGMLIGDYDMAKLASSSMKQKQYGATNTPIFPTLERALSHIRKNR